MPPRTRRAVSLRGQCEDSCSRHGSSPLTPTAQVPLLPGGDTSTRYVKAEVVHHLHPAVIGTCRKIYVLDRAQDRAG